MLLNGTRQDALPGGASVNLGSLRLDELESFVVLAHELHFGRAAQRLFVTPGGLSRRISRLERALGGALLQRTTRTVRVTALGYRLLPTAQRLAADMHQLSSLSTRATLQTALIAETAAAEPLWRGVPSNDT